MNQLLQPIFEITVIFPAAVLCFLPVKDWLRIRIKKLFLLTVIVLTAWCILGGDSLLYFAYSHKYDFNTFFIFMGNPIPAHPGTPCLEIYKCISGGVRSFFLPVRTCHCCRCFPLAKESDHLFLPRGQHLP